MTVNDEPKHVVPARRGNHRGGESRIFFLFVSTSRRRKPFPQQDRGIERIAVDPLSFWQPKCDGASLRPLSKLTSLTARLKDTKIPFVSSHESVSR
jgi:hypothetical protein